MNAALAGLPLAAIAALLVASSGIGGVGPAPCIAEDCAVLAHTAGYAPAVLVIPSGASVVWRNLDTATHFHDGAGCIGVSSKASADSLPVTFEIVDGALRTVTGETVLECAATPAEGEGPFVVTYVCTVHPFLMRGTIVVTAA